MGGQDGTNQGAVGASEPPSRSRIRDVLGEIQLLQSKGTRRSSGTHDEGKMETNQENDENAIDSQQRSDWSSLRTALEAEFGKMDNGAAHGAQRAGP
ncbi:hypothetical protein Aduo_019007 [Ancylostoma duodenale]